MSTTPEPTPEVENPDAEPETQIEGDDADAEEEEHEETQTEPASFDASAEQWRQIDAANDAYIKKVVKIVGQNAPLEGCDRCSGRGFTIGPQEEEVPMIHPENLVECEKCNGYGRIITGSRNPQHVTDLCLTCGGNGYITKPVVPENLYTLAPPPITAQQAQMGTMMPDGTFVPFVPNASTQPAQSYTP